MSFLRKMLANQPVRTPLDFGINENIRLTKIDNSPRKYEGETINRNCWMTFSKFNSKGEVIANSEFAYWNLDHESEYTFQNITDQLGHLQDIVNTLNPGVTLDPTTSFESEEELMDAVGSKKGCKIIQDAMWDEFSAAVAGKIGPESTMLRLKVVTDNKGKYLQLPKQPHIVEDAEDECTLAISGYDLKMKAKGLEAEKSKADTKGDAPDEKPKKKNSLKKL